MRDVELVMSRKLRLRMVVWHIVIWLLLYGAALALRTGGSPKGTWVMARVIVRIMVLGMARSYLRLGHLDLASMLADAVRDDEKPVMDDQRYRRMAETLLSAVSRSPGR
jgi:hypothetical protein